MQQSEKKLIVFDKENLEILKDMVSEATENAVKLIERQKQEKIKGKYDRRLRNTETLLKNYNNFKEHIENSIYATSQIKDENIEEDMDYDEEIEDTFVNSILKSKERTKIMMAHIDNCLEYYTLKCLSSKREDIQRRIQVIKMLYSNEKTKTYEEISEELNCSTKTINNTKREAIKELSALFFRNRWCKIILNF